MLVANSATCPTDSTTSEDQKVLRHTNPMGPDSRNRQSASHRSQCQRERKKNGTGSHMFDSNGRKKGIHRETARNPIMNQASQCQRISVHTPDANGMPPVANGPSAGKAFRRNIKDKGLYSETHLLYPCYSLFKFIMLVRQFHFNSRVEVENKLKEGLQRPQLLQKQIMRQIIRRD